MAGLGEGRERDHLVGEVVGDLGDVVEWDDLSHEADSVGLLRVDKTRRQQDVGGVSGPTSRTRRRISLYPTSMDSRATGIPNRLLSAAMRISVAIDSSQPPPTQNPFIMQIVGFDIASMVSIAPSNASAYTLALAESLR